MSKTCSNCGEEIEVVVSNVIDLSSSGKRYVPSSEEFSVGLAVECGCTQETAQSTELTSIRFSGRPPEGWI